MKRPLIRRLTLFLLLLVLCICASTATFAASKPPKVKNVTAKIVTLQRHRVYWKPVSGADGYMVYGWNDLSGATQYLLAGKVSGGRKSSCLIRNRRANAVYEYRVYAYKMVGGRMVVSDASDPVCLFNNKTNRADTATSMKTVAKQTTTPLVNPSKYEKFYRVFGYVPKKETNRRYPGGLYTTEKKAKANLTAVTVRTWDFVSGTSGQKRTRYFTIEVHKKLAPTVKKIFEAIYRNPDHFPIHDLGGYRTPSGHSEHNTGTAIDINWNENYMISSSGAVLCGSLWRPGVNPYSIPTDGIVVKLFEKYGFAQGLWRSSRDYMHFSYFHT
ncbi:MAG: M15 family metallopeptidase [Lachnospiraceae bacterium]|nr:M15 family metallopeptidase [Lachnospiraceae bacterium]